MNYYAIERWIDKKWERTHLYCAASRAGAVKICTNDGFKLNAHTRLRPYEPSVRDLAMLPVRFGLVKRV